MALTILSVAAILAATALAFVAMRFFDAIVKYEHDHFPEEWQRDGSPSGYFWIAENQRARSSSAGGRLAMKLLRQTPAWIGKTPLEATLRSYRRIFGLLLACLALGLVALALTAVV